MKLPAHRNRGDRALRRTLVSAISLLGAVALLGTCSRTPDEVEVNGLYFKYHHERPRSERSVSYDVDVYGVKYKAFKGNYIDEHIIHFGAYEKYILFFMRDIVKNLDRKDLVFVDVGANTGQHSMYMAKHVSRVHAFDPYEPVLVRFREMVKANGFENITIHPIGLGDRPQKISFYEPPEENFGTGSFVEGMFVSKGKIVLPIEVGDVVAKKANIKGMDIVKVDIEGFEKPALIGLKESLERFRPIVIMELNYRGAHGIPDEAALMKIFPKEYKAYTIFGSQWTGKYRLTPLDDRMKVRTNIVVVPAEKDKAVPKKPDYAPERIWKCPVCREQK